MKYTLLEMTQLIQSSMDSEAVASINDTPESLQVANVIKTVYYDLVSRSNLPEDYNLFNLTATSASTPVVMTLPTTYDNLISIRYNVEDLIDTDQQWRSMKYWTLADFQDRMYRLNESESNIATFNLTINGSTVPVLYWTDRHPTCYTTYDDNTILFDSLDTTVDTFLSAVKTQGYGRRLKTFTMSDSFIPDMDEDQFQLLLQEAKSLAWAELKQSQHQKAEQSARRLKISQQKSKTAIKGLKSFNELAYFGRK